MLSHYPTYREGADAGLVHKLGGLPWGYPLGRWPLCKECGRAMSHLAQVPARAEGAPDLPLAADEVLFAFKCEWDSICSFWEADEGANAVVVLKREELGEGYTEPPLHPEEGAPELLPELGVASWRADDDGAPPELETHFYDYGLHSELPDEVAAPHDWASEWRTKFGGVPYWTANGAQGVPAGRLLFQIDNWVHLQDGSGREVANFCSDGTAYIFADRGSYTLIINR